MNEYHISVMGRLNYTLDGASHSFSADHASLAKHSYTKSNNMVCYRLSITDYRILVSKQ